MGSTWLRVADPAGSALARTEEEHSRRAPSPESLTARRKAVVQLAMERRTGMPRPESFQARSSSGGAVPEPQTRSSLAPDSRTAPRSGLKSAVAGGEEWVAANRGPVQVCAP